MKFSEGSLEVFTSDIFYSEGLAPQTPSLAASLGELEASFEEGAQGSPSEGLTGA